MDKHCQQHDHSGGFMNGFLMGAIIGAAVVFFLFTEKGKKLLETIMEEGSEGFSELRELIEEEMDDDEFEEPVRDTIKPREDDAEHPQRHTALHHQPEMQTVSAAPRVKRFFKRAK